MNIGLPRLVWNNIVGSRFRSAAVFGCAALVASLAILTISILRGVEDSLTSGMERLGADIVVMPWGIMEKELDSAARLMAFPSSKWMPEAYLQKVTAIDGVADASPQLFLASFEDTAYLPGGELLLVAYDPSTDFALRPWLGQQVPGLGAALVGSDVTLGPAENGLALGGKSLQMAGRLTKTGTQVDRAVFVSFETALSLDGMQTGPRTTLAVTPGRVTAFMVRVEPGYSPVDVAVHILNGVPGVIPVEATRFFQAERKQLVGLLRATMGMLALILLLCVLFVGLVFSLTVNERRREVGVLRALGAKKPLIVRMFLYEGAALALSGGALGLLLTASLFSALRSQAAFLTGVPMHIPTSQGWLGLFAAGLGLALVSVILAILVPSSSALREEPALAMKE